MHIVARVVLALCAAAPPAFASAQDKVTVTWQGKAYTSATLPDKLGESPRKVVAQWEPWAKKAATKKAGTGKKKAASKAAKRSSRSTRGRT